MNNSPATQHEEVAPGITLELLANERINLFTFNTVEHTSLKRWADRVKQMIADTPPDKPLMLIQDFSFSKAAMTPALRAHIKELTDYRPEVIVYIGIVLPRTIVTQLVVSFSLLMQRGNRITKGFFTRKEAIAWVEGLLKKQG